MTYHSENLAALIGSRICHDLISPIGAVNNGLELLALSGVSDGPEMSLVTDSAASANARIRLFRLAFGVASDLQETRADEVIAIWSGVQSEGRITLSWDGPSSLPRPMARVIILACLCAEEALPLGGTLRVDQSEDIWRVTAIGDKLAVDSELWACLSGPCDAPDIQPAHVQFLLLSKHLGKMNRQCSYMQSQDTLRITF